MISYNICQYYKKNSIAALSFLLMQYSYCFSDSITLTEENTPYCIYAKYVLTNNGVLSDKYVLICDEIICSISNFPVKNIPMILGSNHILSPAFINSHDHIEYNHKGPIKYLCCDSTLEKYDQRHDWRKGCRGFKELEGPENRQVEVVAWNELKQLISGTTTVVSSGGVRGFLRNLGTEKSPNLYPDPKREGLVSQRVFADTFPLGDAEGIQISAGDAYPKHPDKNKLHDCIYIPHVAEGIDCCARNEFINISNDNGKCVNILGRNTGCIHMIALLDHDISNFAKSGASLIWSPRSNLSLYGNTAAVTYHRSHGVNICLGTDWAYSGSMNLLDELKLAYHFNRDYLYNTFSCKELWKMVTVNPADLLNVSDQLGDIKVGMKADLVLFEMKFLPKKECCLYGAAINSPIENIDLVTRGGKIIYGAKPTLSPLFGYEKNWERILVNKKEKMINIIQETDYDEYVGEMRKMSFTKLQELNKDNYPLFTNEEDSDKPCGVPRRSRDRLVPNATVYPIYPRSIDFDMDGIPNSFDSSPVFFNPIRPLDITDNAEKQPSVGLQINARSNNQHGNRTFIDRPFFKIRRK